MKQKRTGQSHVSGYGRQYKDTVFRLIHREKNPCLELVVTQYNINEGHSRELLESSRTLKGYGIFVSKVRAGHDSGLSVKEAVKRAVDECIGEHVLEDIFRNHYREVVKMGEAEFWEELHYQNLRREGYEDGREEGLKNGKEEGMKEGMKEGLRQGIQILICTCKELGASYEATWEQIGKRYHLDDDAVGENMKLYW